jgi:hypothetical protein
MQTLCFREEGYGMDKNRIGPARVGDRVWFQHPATDEEEAVPGRSDRGMNVGRVIEVNEADCYLLVAWEGRHIRLERGRIIGINRAAPGEWSSRDSRGGRPRTEEALSHTDKLGIGEGRRPRHRLGLG